MRSIIASFRPVQFFALYFALTWTPYWLAVLSERNQWPIPSVVFMVLVGVGALSAALIMVYTSGDRAVVRDYWDRVFNFRRIRGRWWLLVVFGMPALKVVIVLISVLLGGSPDQFRFSAAFAASPLALAAMLFFFGPLPEELGLRGYGIDSLRSRFNGFDASLVMGVLWAAWHIPSVFMPDSFHNKLLAYPPAFVSFFVWTVALAFIYTWIFYNNRRSTLALILFHYFDNLSGEMIDLEMETRVIQAVVLVAFAVVIVLWDRKTFWEAALPADNAAG